MAGVGLAAMVSGCGDAVAPAQVPPPARDAAGSASKAGAKTAARATTPAAPEVQRFRSRPDLMAPRVIVARRPPGVGLSAAEPLVLTDTHASGQQGPLILNRAGELVWFLPLSDGGTSRLRAFNVRVQQYGGEPVLSWWQGAVVGAHGVGHYELRDQRYRTVAQVQGANGYAGDLHEFLITDRGTALFTCYGQATVEIPDHTGSGSRQGAVWYGVVQEVEIATGRLLFQWRSIDHVPVTDSYHLPPPPDPTAPWDYFHVNSISVDPADGNLVISARNTWTVYKVDRGSGAVIWRLGGRESDFALGRGAHFAFQHDVTMHPGGVLTIFDNEGGPPNEASRSRGLVLAIDERARTAKVARQYLHHPPVLSPALGSVQLLSGGRAFVGWGDSSWFTEYDARGRPMLDAHLPAGCISYRAFEEAWTARPTTRPALAVARAGHDAELYASWNGATEHRRWRVLSGRDAASLRASATVDVKGFETRITVGRPGAWVAVEALDAHGKLLGRSNPERV
ncbi:MAG: arylsulfotransferase family protein [Solirubrobacteraceae bacterium]